MKYQDNINLDDVEIRPTHLEAIKEIERLILEKEVRDGIQKSESGRRNRY